MIKISAIPCGATDCLLYVKINVPSRQFRGNERQRNIKDCTDNPIKLCLVSRLDLTLTMADLIGGKNCLGS